MKRLLTILLVLILAMAVAGLLYARSLTRRGFSAHDQPIGLQETFLARTMQSASIPDACSERAQSVDEPRHPRRDGRGARRHFADHCSVCHGNDGLAASRKRALGDSILQAAGHAPARDAEPDDGELYYIIENGVRMTGMPAWGDPNGGLQDDDSWKLVLFIRHLPPTSPRPTS